MFNRVEWLRGGASPETQLVTYELSINGGASWAPLGNGSRITGGWERTGLSLPTSGQIRARARITNGIYCGSSGLVEMITSYNANVNQGTWRQYYFGTTANAGKRGRHGKPRWRLKHKPGGVRLWYQIPWSAARVSLP